MLMGGREKAHCSPPRRQQGNNDQNSWHWSYRKTKSRSYRAKRHYSSEAGKTPLTTEHLLMASCRSIALSRSRTSGPLEESGRRSRFADCVFLTCDACMPSEGDRPPLAGAAASHAEAGGHAAATLTVELAGKRQKLT